MVLLRSRAFSQCITHSGHAYGISMNKYRVMISTLFSVRPVIKVPSHEVAVAEGEDAILECEVEAFPKGVYYWEMDTGLYLFYHYGTHLQPCSKRSAPHKHLISLMSI